MLLTPLPCHKPSHLLGPPPLERDVLYGRPLSRFSVYENDAARLHWSREPITTLSAPSMFMSRFIRTDYHAEQIFIPHWPTTRRGAARDGSPRGLWLNPPLVSRA